jgi:hypothetical protein
LRVVRFAGFDFDGCSGGGLRYEVHLNRSGGVARDNAYLRDRGLLILISLGAPHPVKQVELLNSFLYVRGPFYPSDVAATNEFSASVGRRSDGRPN